MLSSTLILLLLQAMVAQADTKNDLKANCVPGPHNQASSPEVTAPESFTVYFNTSASTDQLISLEVTRSWAPLGADRFYGLMLDNYFDCASFFRIAPGCVK